MRAVVSPGRLVNPRDPILSDQDEILWDITTVELKGLLNEKVNDYFSTQLEAASRLRISSPHLDKPKLDTFYKTLYATYREFKDVQRNYILPAKSDYFYDTWKNDEVFKDKLLSLYWALGRDIQAKSGLYSFRMSSFILKYEQFWGPRNTTNTFPGNLNPYIVHNWQAQQQFLFSNSQQFGYFPINLYNQQNQESQQSNLCCSVPHVLHHQAYGLSYTGNHHQQTATDQTFAYQPLDRIGPKSVAYYSPDCMVAGVKNEVAVDTELNLSDCNELDKELLITLCSLSRDNSPLGFDIFEEPACTTMHQGAASASETNLSGSNDTGNNTATKRGLSSSPTPESSIQELKSKRLCSKETDSSVANKSKHHTEAASHTKAAGDRDVNLSGTTLAKHKSGTYVNVQINTGGKYNAKASGNTTLPSLS